MSDGMFAGIKEKKASGRRRDWYTEGRYIVRLDAIRISKSTRNSKKWCCIDGTVVYVDPTSIKDWEKLGSVASTRPCRDKQEVVQMWDTTNDYFLSEYKAALIGILGVSEDQVDEGLCEMASGPDNPLAGTFVQVTVKTRTLKKKEQNEKEKEFTRIAYDREVTAEELRAILLGSPSYGQQYIDSMFPNGGLDKLVEAEKALAAANPS